MKTLHFNIKSTNYTVWLSFFIDTVISTFVEIEDELPDVIVNYFKPVFINVRARNGRRRELKREIDLTKKDLIHSIRGDEVEWNRKY